MAEDKDQNAKINLPTKTDDPKGWMGPVMAGGPPTVNSICPAPPTQFTLLFGGRREERRHGIKHPHGPCGSSTYVPLPKPNQTAFSWSKVALSLPFSISLYPPTSLFTSLCLPLSTESKCMRIKTTQSPLPQLKKQIRSQICIFIYEYIVHNFASFSYP